MSHASKDGKEVIELYRRIRKVCPAQAILFDVQGPKIRIGTMEEEVTLEHGAQFNLYEDEIIGDKSKASISYRGFYNDVQIGNSIFINDGLVRLEVIDKNAEDRSVITLVIAGGPISSRKGVNIPEGTISMQNPTEKDVHDLKLIAELNPEFVAASFVSNASEVNHVRSILSNGGASKVKIISKIERPIALQNFDEILEASDGIMVARGDLGVEIAAEMVPIRQKEMILACNKAGKPVIVATQMLESMTNNPVPTRAEVNDVFNAVYDRADAVMLSGETSVGKFPNEAVRYMDRIIKTAEEYIPKQDPTAFDSDEPDMYESVGHAVYELANVFQKVNFRGKIVMFTRDGKSPEKAAKYRPEFPILAITNKSKTARQMSLTWGVEPFYLPTLNISEWDAERTMQHGILHLVQYGAIELKEHVICTIPSKISPGRCSLIGLYYVEDILNGIEIKEQTYHPPWK
jgi:pyruvate kinase